MINISSRIHKLVIPLVIFTIFSIYLAFALPSFNRPFVADDTTFAQEAERPPNLDALWHPPLYCDILRALTNGFKLTRENLRLFGIFCFAVNLVFIYFLSQEISKNWKSGLLACLLFATHPMAIQGSLILDIDNTILAVLSTVFVFYFVRTYTEELSIHDLFMGGLFFVFLWAKFAVPLIFISSVFLFYVLKKDFGAGIRKTLLIGGLGTSVFIVVWLLYAKAYSLPYLGVFERSLDVLGEGLSGSSLPVLRELPLRIVRVALWLCPYLVLIWFLMVSLRIRNYFQNKSLEMSDFCLLYISLIFIVHIFIGGTSFGFAKYHYPVLPILSVLISDFFFKLDVRPNRKTFIFCGIIGLFFLPFVIFGVGDLIYSINYTLRQIVIFTPEELPSFLGNFTMRLGLYFLLLIVGFLVIPIIYKKRNWLKAVVTLTLILAFLGNLSLDVMQKRADYFTTYCYGRDIAETERVEDFFKELKARDPDGIIIGPEDILHNAGIKLSEYNYSVLWDDRKKFIEAITDKRVICVAYGFGWNAVFTYKNIFFNETVQRLLQDNYRPLEFGTYSVWLRK